MTRDGFCRIWREWDEVMAVMPRHPNANYGKRATDRLVDAELDLVAGVSHHVLHARLTAARREGMSYEQAFDSLKDAA